MCCVNMVKMGAAPPSPIQQYTLTVPLSFSFPPPSIYRIGSMRKTGVLERPFHPNRDNASSPVRVKQKSPDSLSQCSGQSCGSAGSAKSLPVTIPAQEELSFPFTRQSSDPGLVAGFSSPPEHHSPTEVRYVATQWCVQWNLQIMAHAGTRHFVLYREVVLCQ